MNDPTYDRDLINAKREWRIAFTISEMLNDNAPLGWGKYIPTAEAILKDHVVVPRGEQMVVPDGEDQDKVDNLHDFLKNLYWESAGDDTIIVESNFYARAGDTLVRDGDSVLVERKQA